MTSQVEQKLSRKELAFPALHHRDFRFFFIGTMLAMMGDNIEHVVSYWVLFQKFHSPVLAGFADISHWTPFLLLSVYFGGLLPVIVSIGESAEVPLAGSGRFCRHQPLDTVSFAFRLLRRTRRSIRLPEGRPVRPDPVHECLCGLGHTLFHQYDSGLACVASPDCSRYRRRDVGACRAVADSRHCWHGASSERRSAQRHQPAARDTFRTGGRGRANVVAGTVVGSCCESPHLFSIDLVAAVCPLHRASPQRGSAEKSDWLERCGERLSGSCAEPPDYDHGAFGRYGIIVRRQCISNADAWVRIRSGCAHSRFCL